jgi:hypothetical protein
MRLKKSHDPDYDGQGRAQYVEHLTLQIWSGT